MVATDIQEVTNLHNERGPGVPMEVFNEDDRDCIHRLRTVIRTFSLISKYNPS